MVPVIVYSKTVSAYYFFHMVAEVLKRAKQLRALTASAEDLSLVHIIQLDSSELTVTTVHGNPVHLASQGMHMQIHD